MSWEEKHVKWCYIQDNCHVCMDFSAECWAVVENLQYEITCGAWEVRSAVGPWSSLYLTGSPLVEPALRLGSGGRHPLYLLDENKNSLVVRASSGDPEPFLSYAAIRPGCVMHWAPSLALTTTHFYCMSLALCASVWPVVWFKNHTFLICCYCPDQPIHCFPAVVSCSFFSACLFCIIPTGWEK